MMLKYALLASILYIMEYYYVVLKRKKYVTNNYNEIKKIERINKQIRFNDVFSCLYFLVLTLINKEFALLYIPLFTLIFINKVKQEDKIIVLDKGLLFNKTYIKWLEVDKTYIKNKNTLVICSRGLKGKFHIYNILDAEKLDFEITKLLK